MSADPIENVCAAICRDVSNMDGSRWTVQPKWPTDFSPKEQTAIRNIATLAIDALFSEQRQED